MLAPREDRELRQNRAIMSRARRTIPPALLLATALLLPVRAPADGAAGKSAGDHLVVLVRHGNYDADDPRDPAIGKMLVPLGVAQARLAGSRLRALPMRFDEIVASPLSRARQTAELIAGELGAPPPRIDPELAECTPPTRRADVMAGEKPEDLAACQAQLERLARRLLAPSADGSRRTLVVAHGNVIRYLVTRALAVDPTAWLGFSVGHASLTVIAIDAAGVPRVVAVGDVGHLPPSFQSGAVGDLERDLALPRPRS